MRRSERRAGGFYDSPAWRTVRMQALRRDGFRCTICGCSIARPGKARVDHIKPLRTHPHLGLILDNLRSLCVADDNRNRERSGSPRTERIGGCGRDGRPYDPKHPWNRAV
jgi:5-methylcytosine-specific restriction endonuclease McrA